MAESELPLQKMQTVSWVVLAVLVVGTALLVSSRFAFSVLAGGVISIGSFWVSRRDIVSMVDTISGTPEMEERQARARQGQKGYLLKFWLRLVIVGIGLLVLIKYQLVNIFGLILGLSTVVLAITFIAMEAAGQYFFRGRR